MATTLGNFTTAAEATALYNPTEAQEQIKQQIDSQIRLTAVTGKRLTVMIPKAWSAAAVTILETEGYTAVRTVLPDPAAYDQIDISWP